MKNSSFAPRVRGIVSARAESNISATLNELNTTFAAFREANDRRLGELERGRGDVVTAEQVERINASVTELTTTVNAQRETIDALRIGGGAGGDPAISAEQRAYSQAFNTYFRRGRGEDELGALAARAALSTQVDPDGGFVVPVEMDSQITRVLSTVSAMRGISRVITTATGSYKALVSQGGAAGSWVGEESARSLTAEARLSEITTFVGEIAATPSATQVLLDDASIDIAAWLAAEVATTFAEMEGAAFITGNGINRPKGFLAYPTVANASYAWGSLGFTVTGAAAAFAATNPADAIINLFYSLKAGYRNNATFVTSDVVMGTIRQMKDGQGNYLWAPPTVDGPDTILGKPVVTDDNMPALAASAFPVAFGDFSRGYLISDRSGVTVLRDPYTNKPYVNFYTVKRVGGAVQNFEAIKLLRCST
jgi:HK97 family phage major capsid protein